MPLHLRLRGVIWHARGAVRVGRHTIQVPEFSTDCRRRADAEAAAADEEPDRLRLNTRSSAPSSTRFPQAVTAPSKRELFKPERLLAFSDGVFGVAITLLVIDLRLPPMPTEDDAALPQALLGMGPKLFVFAFTFIIVGMSWWGHHRKFSYIHLIDDRLLWINLFYLMALCLVPFASSVLSEHSNRTGFILYVGVMAIVDLLSASLSLYGLREPLLGERTISTRRRRDMALSPFLTSVIFVMAGCFAFSGLLQVAHWSLLLIVPSMAFFGSRSGTTE